jgi:hypothetical protein
LVSESFYRRNHDEILKVIPEENECKIKDYDPKTKMATFPVIEKD